VGPGAADRSYGIQVAKLAGLPQAVLARAEAVLEALEQDGKAIWGQNAGSSLGDLPLFNLSAPLKAETETSAVEAALRAADIDQLSPRQALDLLYALKARLE